MSSENPSSQPACRADSPEALLLHSEVLLLPDGQVLVHNLTPEFSRLLSRLGMIETRDATTTDPNSNAP